MPKRMLFEKDMFCIYLLLGYPPQTGTAVLRIFVDDLNDNAPQFVLPYPPMVMELVAPPTFVITFSATDRDIAKYGAPFSFSLPPCEENPTCKDGNLEFTLDFDPGKLSDWFSKTLSHFLAQVYLKSLNFKHTTLLYAQNDRRC